ncbi:DUF4129 domain-containing protein [Streptomyces sp. NPDC001282]|uniref:DUF4129 domain-containing protein n=1 Tax=Streptomyces sp. NPDC001282 TaxID=3364557 RepID=UPI00369C1F4C
MSGVGRSTAAQLLVRASGDIPVDTPRVPAREAAERELSKPMYHENDPGLLRRGLEQLWDWLGDLLNMASGAAPGGPLGLVVLALAVIGLVAALWWRLGTPRGIVRTTDTLFDDVPRTAAEHRAAAETHAAAQRWNEAIQERMRAIVRSLEERALIDQHPGRTADEAAAEAARLLPSHATRLRAAARDFDDVTYGGRTTNQQAYSSVRELDIDLEAAKPLLTTAAQGAAE